MGELANGKRVSCELTGAKTYDRLVGTCYLGDQDIGVAVIAAGLALDCPRYSDGRYAEYEVAAARTACALPRPPQNSEPLDGTPELDLFLS